MAQNPFSVLLAISMKIIAKINKHFPKESIPYLPYINLINFSLISNILLTFTIIRYGDGKSINSLLKIYKIVVLYVIIIGKVRGAET